LRIGACVVEDNDSFVIEDNAVDEVVEKVILFLIVFVLLSRQVVLAKNQAKKPFLSSERGGFLILSLAKFDSRIFAIMSDAFTGDF
jgi:hypothetical protein